MASLPDVLITPGARTPIGRFGGSLAEVTAAEMGAAAAREALRRAGIEPAAVDEVIFGNARQAGGGPNPARQVAWKAGVPQDAPAWTINMACASSMHAIASAAWAVARGDASCVLAGGTESMSRLPYLLPRARWGYRLGSAEVVDAMYQDGFLDPLSGLLMGETAENLARIYGISREEQDRYALESQRRCEAARAAGAWKEESFPFPLPAKKGAPASLDADEHPRADTTPASLAKLPPVFSKEGTVTAGNACGIVDGAAAVVVLSADRARDLGVRAAFRIVDAVSVGVDPSTMGIGPVPAVRKLLARTGVPLSGVDRIELNEAFAVQVLACVRDLGLDPERLNVNGGAIALGHPIGATGCRIVVTLLHEMQRRDSRHGIATLCVSGGLGHAILFERL